MTAPLPLPSIAPVAPASIADALGAKATPSNKKGPSFSEVLAQQRPAQQRPDQAAGSRPANKDAKAPSGGKSSNDPAGTAEQAAAGAIDAAVQTAGQAEAGALAVAATQPATVLPQQALEIAAQAAEQVQLARGNAVAAASAMSTGATVLTAALNAADTAAPMPAPVAATAEQAQAAASQAVRDAQAALPVVTAAVKPGSSTPAQVPADAKAAIKTDASHLAAQTALPGPARDLRAQAEPAAQLPLDANDEPLSQLVSTAEQFHAPAHGGAAAQDTLAQALAAATQRQAVPLAANQAAVAAPVVPVVLQVATPVGATHWGTELDQQMVMMSNNVRHGTQTAELRLDPPDLGPLRVSLNLADGVAAASFVSAHASVRQAIETAIPQLQQALAQAGISLGQTSVGEQAAQQEFAQQNGGGSQGQQRGGSAAAQGQTEGNQPAVHVVRNSNALVDTFA